MRHRQHEKPLPYVNAKDLLLKQQRSQSSNTNSRKEQFQVMKSNSRLPEYQPLCDKHLSSFIERNRIRRHLLKLGLLKDTSELRSSKAIEPSIEDLPKITKDPQLSMPVMKKEQITTKNTARAFLSKADFQRYIQQVRSKVTSVKEQQLSHSLLQ